LLRQRVDIIKDYWRGAVYYAHFVGQRDIDEGLEIARKVGRKDLEEELIDFLDQLHNR